LSTQRSTLYVYDQYLGQCTLSEEKDLQASGLSDLYRFSTESAFSQASGHLDQDATGREIYSGSTSILNDVELRSESLGSSKRVAGSVDHVKRSYRYRTFKLREDLFSQLGDYCYYSTCSKRNAARIDEDVRVVDAILCKKTAGRGEFTSIPTLAMAIAGIEQELQRGFRIARTQYSSGVFVSAIWGDCPRIHYSLRDSVILRFGGLYTDNEMYCLCGSWTARSD